MHMQSWRMTALVKREGVFTGTIAELALDGPEYTELMLVRQLERRLGIWQRSLRSGNPIPEEHLLTKKHSISTQSLRQ